MKHFSGKRPAITRRRPQQTRAQHTTAALQEALVRVLLVHDYDAVTIRDITDMAGVAIGSFYEYFANKNDLARVCVHLRSKRLLRVLQAADGAPASLPLDTIVDQAVQRLLAAHRDMPRHWGTCYLMERRFSNIAAYTKMYDRFVGVWQHLLKMSSDRVCPCPADTARVCQTIVYGLFAHAHMRGLPAAEVPVDPNELHLQAWQALSGYLMLASVPVDTK